MTTATETLKAAVDALGLTYKADFVPFSKSRNAKKTTKPSDYSLNWKITLSKGSRSLSTDYQAGIAHIPGYQQSWSGRMSVDQFEGIKQACETGKGGAYDSRKIMPMLTWKPIPAPELYDVLHCLVLDAGALDAGSFEEWASEFDYETDSRKAEKIYKECLNIALQLRALIGEAGIQSVRDAGQDY